MELQLQRIEGALKKKRKCKHGFSDHPLYQTYKAMIKRCYNSNSISHKYYGAKGISICDEWLISINNFIKWSLHNGYSKGLTLDRINNEGDYTPENCRWVSVTDNNRNKSNNVLIEIDGITKVLKAWCEVLNISYNTVEKRLLAGWEVKEALFTPIRKKRKNETIAT